VNGCEPQHKEQTPKKRQTPNANQRVPRQVPKARNGKGYKLQTFYCTVLLFFIEH